MLTFLRLIFHPSHQTAYSLWELVGWRGAVFKSSSSLVSRLLPIFSKCVSLNSKAYAATSFMCLFQALTSCPLPRRLYSCLLRLHWFGNSACDSSHSLSRTPARPSGNSTHFSAIPSAAILRLVCLVHLQPSWGKKKTGKKSIYFSGRVGQLIKLSKGLKGDRGVDGGVGGWIVLSEISRWKDSSPTRSFLLNRLVLVFNFCNINACFIEGT